MKDWLVQHAYKNVWCHPASDRRRISKPGRISRLAGERWGMQVSGYSIKLPADNWYHVFQIGSFTPQSVGLDKLKNKWIRLDIVTASFDVVINLYNDEGRLFPLSKAYIRLLDSNLILIAIEDDNQQIDFAVESLYAYFYDGNARYANALTSEYDNSVVSRYIEVSGDRTLVMRDYNALAAKEGAVYMQVDGELIRSPNVNDLKRWTHSEIYHDALIEEIHEFPVGDLRTFSSKLDLKMKYLIHFPKQEERIKFFNDLRIELYNGKMGRYVSVNLSSDLRQVTHNDFSLSTNKVTSIAAAMGWGDIAGLTLRVYLRRSGWDRPLIFDSSKITYLYKLDDQGIIDAMTGNNSTVVEWQAANLENAAYVKLMASHPDKILNPLCTDAYGYNYVAISAADTPQRTVVDSSTVAVELPDLLANKSTVYEYTTDGLLLGAYKHSSATNNRYICANKNAGMVEAITNWGDDDLDIIYDAVDGIVIEPFHNYRFYEIVLKSGVRTNEWNDITGDSSKYVIDSITNKVTWLLDRGRRMPVLWSDKSFLSYTLNGDLTDGIAEFQIDHYDAGYDGYYPLLMPPETLELWLEGHSLIEGLDYFVKWPKVVVCNKEYLAKSAARLNPRIFVRGRGLSKDLRKYKNGYIVDGLLSDNNVFDVRRDKLVRVTIGGKLQLRNELDFREDLAVGVNTALNGLPYSVSDPSVPLGKLVTGNTYDLRNTARDLDIRTEDYLTNFYDIQTKVVNNPIPNKHRLFSPIMYKVLSDLQSGILLPVIDPELNYLSTAEFDKLMEPYIYLLDFEPTREGVDLRYVDVEVHPHLSAVVVEALHFSIIEKMNDRYLANRVNLNKLIQIKV